MLAKTQTLTIDKVNFSILPSIESKELTKILTSLIDISSTSTNRGTFYNTKEEQEAATLKAHKELLIYDRGVYAATLLLPGTNDYNLQLGIYNLLSNNYTLSTLSLEDDTLLINKLIDKLSEASIPRLLKLFLRLKTGKVNNARTKKALLRVILNNKSFDFWTVKYRTKLREIFIHIWGNRQTSIIKNILYKKLNGESLTFKENNILFDSINKHVDVISNRVDLTLVFENISFILGNKISIKNKFTNSFLAAKENINAGDLLPKEILEGLRSVYHKTIPTATVLELTKQNLTAKETLTVQRNAKEKDVEVSVNLNKQKSIDLYVSILETGEVNDEIIATLINNGKKAAANFPNKYNKPGILLDCSYSMRGNELQKNRPIATALSIRDMLIHTNLTEQYSIRYVGGEPISGNMFVQTPSSNTSLAQGLVSLLKDNCDVIFILSDGYENSPAGRTDEVITVLREKLNIQTPIIHINPVAAAEAKGVRNLGSRLTTIGATDANSLGTSLFKSLILNNPQQALPLLFNTVFKQLK